MSIHQNFSTPKSFPLQDRGRQTREFVRYTPAVLKHNARGFYVEYFCRHPDSDLSVRFRQNLNKLHQKLPYSDFRRTATVLVTNINARLASGWTPFADDDNSLKYTPIRDALYTYLDRKRNELRPATLVSYKSVIDILLHYLDTAGMGQITIGNFTRFSAIRFLDYLVEDKTLSGKKKRALSNNAWNTYLKKYCAIFGFMVERGYLQENPFAGIRKKPKEDKRRRVVSDYEKQRILNWVMENNPNYLVVLLLIYNSLIRPKEIELIRVGDVDLAHNWVHVPADNAKTHKERYAPLTPQLVQILSTWNLSTYPDTYYLIGTRYAPARAKAYHGKYKKDFIQIRKQLGLSDGIQLYSWKDTGISDMFSAGLDALTIMHAADHHDLSVTTRYACQANTDMIRKVCDKAPALMLQ